jgi:iron-sulfur cluster assembly protein
MALDDNIADDDEVLEVDGLKVLIDPMSAPYLEGAHVDYVETMMGAGFKIDNPNAVATCGCGSSFKAQQGTVSH